MRKTYKCIIAVVNNGFSEVVMETARALGAKGGTVLHGRGTISKDAEKFFNITIQPDKEIVIILAKTELVEPILKGLYGSVGTSTPAQGIAFAMPVDNVIGIDENSTIKKENYNKNN